MDDSEALTTFNDFDWSYSRLILDVDTTEGENASLKFLRVILSFKEPFYDYACLKCQIQGSCIKQQIWPTFPSLKAYV